MTCNGHYIQIYSIYYKPSSSSHTVKMLMYIVVYDKCPVSADDIEYQLKSYINRYFPDVLIEYMDITRTITIYRPKDVKLKIRNITNACVKNNGSMIVGDKYKFGYYIFKHKSDISKTISDIVKFNILYT